MTPLPISRLEARAAGLKVYTGGLRCPRNHTTGRSVFNGKCLGCVAHDRAALEVIKATVRAETLKTARARIVRGLAREAKAAEAAKAKADRDKERATARAERAAGQKKAASKATREARKAAAEAAKGIAAAEGLAVLVSPIQEDFDSLPPWDGEAAPWA